MNRVSTMHYGTRQTRARERREAVAIALGGIAFWAVAYAALWIV